MDIAYAKKKVEAFRKRAETAEEKYQISGERRYYLAQIEYELIADAIDAQLRNDDVLSEIASLLHSNATVEELRGALKNLVATASAFCRYQGKY